MSKNTQFGTDANIYMDKNYELLIACNQWDLYKSIADMNI